MKHIQHISTYCLIQDNRIILDGAVAYESDAVDFISFIKAAYKAAKVEYPKFYKMDNLSKLGFVAAEYMLKGKDRNNDIALLLANRSGSLDTDLKHADSIRDADNYYPSPAVFVYTLANICAGEISIRHGMRTENAFFIAEDYDYNTMFNYTEYLLLSGRADKVLCGWIELYGDKYKAVLYLVEETGIQQHNVEQIEKLFLR